ncbi:LysR family transcriptional regulator [Spiractinospora alimapuensis]|uniref:LysR family transcriptional regulator n=1 Tax=Spiractinospora alimapuensis TaxID=2820884 RepID=UPI001F2D20E5|nr:LysR family transcriptional regulator [Spiractinospora alimapuensis]QVQ54505.1 LysR family transcriptional regulator [Spiractinospora alimapuensis]
MEFRHLRYFSALAEEGSFNRAAARLHISQPSLSRQLRELERHLGTVLIDRGPRGATLTAAGTALLEHARQLLTLEAATAGVVAGVERTRELVRVGLPPGLPTQWATATAHRVATDVPTCDLEYTEENSAQQLREVRQGRLDIGVVHQAPPADEDSVLLWREPMGAAVRPGHPLTDAEEFRLEDLNGQRVLVHSRDQVPTQQDGIMAAALAANVHPDWRFARFAEYARPCAEAARADAVLVGAHTAAAHLSDWTWRPLAGLSLAMSTWLVWPRHTRTVVAAVAGAIADTPPPGLPSVSARPSP